MGGVMVKNFGNENSGIQNSAGGQFRGQAIPGRKRDEKGDGTKKDKKGDVYDFMLFFESFNLLPTKA